MRKVVVTGLGALTPIGNNVPAYWQGLVQGKSGAERITRFDTSRHKTQIACELKDYRSEDYFEPREAKKLDPYTQYALVATAEALQDTQLVLAQEDLTRIGVVWGIGMGGIETVAENITYFDRSGEAARMHPSFVPKGLGNMAGGQIAIKYGLRGPSFTALSACASASNAIMSAAQLIQLGYADVMVCGGSEAAITPVGISGFGAIKALSTRNEDPQTASRPFDRDRDGFVMGEGAGVLVLEAHERAQSRGAKVYAALIGMGMSTDAYHIITPHPEGQGIALAMKNALQYAGIQPQAVDYINAHGTSTLLGDVCEAKAIRQVFKEHAYRLSISATKSMTGHLLGAAGAIESVATILALQHQVVPPTINHFADDPALDAQLNFTFNQAQPRSMDVALTNTLGFGGHNTAIIYQRYD